MSLLQLETAAVGYFFGQGGVGRAGINVRALLSATVVSLANGAIEGFELWFAGSTGSGSSSINLLFYPVAEGNRFPLPLGAWVLQRLVGNAPLARNVNGGRGKVHWNSE